MDPTAAKVFTVVPAYQSEATVGEVVSAFASLCEMVIVVDDGSTDGTAAAAESGGLPNVVVLRRSANGGVGAAMKTGLAEALERGADIVVKADADGQMDPEALPALLARLTGGRADVAKGNRWFDRRALLNMPRVRRIGNVALSFALRLASGQWKTFDPANGYIAWKASFLRSLDLGEVPDDFRFESAMLVEAGLARARVDDVPIPARYGNQGSHMGLGRQLLVFPPFLVRSVIRRFWRVYFVTDFNAVSLLLAAGLPLTFGSTVFGSYHWVASVQTGVPATAGTVLLAALPFLMGFSCLLNALILDVAATPDRPAFDAVDRPNPEAR